MIQGCEIYQHTNNQKVTLMYRLIVCILENYYDNTGSKKQSKKLEV